MADAAPVVPAVSSFDPVEWTRKIEGLNKRINDLEDDKQSLQAQNRDLKEQTKRLTSEAAGAKSGHQMAKGRLKDLEGFIAENEDLKELKRLRGEVAKMHTERAKKEREQAEADRKTEAQVKDLTLRATRAEGKFLALESTASMMATSRDNANASAAKLMEERDQALEKLKMAQEDLAQMNAELVKTRNDLKQKSAPAAPAAKAK